MPIIWVDRQCLQGGSMKKNNLLFSTVLFCSLAFACIPALASAVQSSQSGIQLNKAQLDDNWHFLFAPYLWASSLSGNITIGNYTANIDESFRYLLRHLDFGAQAHIEASRGRWTFMVDPTYLKLSDDFTLASLASKVTQKMWLVDTGIFARVIEFAATEQPTTVELLGGGRYMGLSADLDIASLVSFSNTENSFSPIIGMRIKHMFNPRTQLWIRGDYGGFHVDGMNQTWSANAGLSYAVGKHWEIGVAYRILKLDFTDNANHFALNTLMYGPMVGVGFFN